MNDNFEHWKTLLGKRVIITLEHSYKESIIAEGILLAFDDSGEAVIKDEMGFIHFCWPMLKVKEVEILVDHDIQI